MVKREVEIETVGECVDEIDKLAELIGKHESDQHWEFASLTNLTSVTKFAPFKHEEVHSAVQESYKCFSTSWLLSPPERSDLSARVPSCGIKKIQLIVGW
ncbi:hypothetical protein Tco_0469569 [Tanacetum coccineum]